MNEKVQNEKQYLTTYQCKRCPHTRRTITPYDPSASDAPAHGLRCPLCGSTEFVIERVIPK